MNNLFINCNSLTSINLNNFYTNNVKDMNSLFYNCSKLTSINISNFNTKNVENISNMCYGCISLKSINLSNFNTGKIKNYSKLFYNCNNLNYVDISYFSNNNIISINIFNEKIPSYGKIVLKSDFLNKIENQINSWKKIISSETRPKICDIGYYIPIDDESLFDCQKCSLDYCAYCNGTYEKNDCFSCKNKLEPIYNSTKIIGCINTCQTGEEEKCLTCYKDRNECERCNIGYKKNNGICEVDYLIKAIYYTKGENQNIQLIYSTNSVNKMIIDGLNYNKTYTSFQFEKSGNHTIYFSFIGCQPTGLFQNIEHLISFSFSNFYLKCKMPDNYEGFGLEKMFYGCKNLTYVDFSNLNFFINSSMYRMFYNCISLKYINLNSSIKIQAKNLEEMFYNCYSLTYIDISNIIVNTSLNFGKMFQNCISLESINLTNFKALNARYMNSMFKNCYKLKILDLSYFKPSKLYNIQNMFYNCYSLTSINFSNFNIYDVKWMQNLFYGCSSLKSLNLSTFYSENKYVSIEKMFTNCKNLSYIDLSEFEPDAQNYKEMFINVSTFGKINLKESFYNKIKDYIPSKWNITIK